MNLYEKQDILRHQTYIGLVKNRSLKVSNAFSSIDEAKGILTHIEELTAMLADEKKVDAMDVSKSVVRLKELADSVLVNIIESLIIDERSQGND